MSVKNPRESAAFIASVAKDVKINPTGVKKVASEMLKAIEKGEFKTTRMMIHEYPIPVTEDSSSVEWMFVADTLNFSFWAQGEDDHYSVELKGVVYTGYMAMCAALTKALEAGIPITSAKYYANISEEDVNKIFLSSDGRPVPMVKERVKNLREAGQVVLEKFNGEFINCVKQSDQSAQKLLNLIISNFPSYRDEAVIEGQRVSFYKRAQILVSDIWAVFKGKGLGKFDDMDTITMFADYRVPQALVHFGALEYSDELNEKLRQTRLFNNGDREEVEIRGCSIHVVELIREELKDQKISDGGEPLPLNSAVIDYFLWEYRRRFAKELAQIPYHRVRCIYY